MTAPAVPGVPAVPSGQARRIAVIGGTGALGSGLARRWAQCGHLVTIGSRSPERAHDCAAELTRELDLPAGKLTGAGSVEAAAQADIIVLTVPWSSHAETLSELTPVLAGQILIDATVPLVPPKVSVVQLPAEGSAALAAARRVGERARVVSAFHHVSAAKLRDTTVPDCDVLVFGDDAAARGEVVALIESLGMRGVEGGVLANSVAAEALTSVLIGINRRYKVPGAGLRITGLGPDPRS